MYAEDVAETPAGLDADIGFQSFQFSPQTWDADVDHVAHGLRLRIIDVIFDFSSGNHWIGMHHEALGDAVFLGGQDELLAMAKNLFFPDIQRETADM